MKHEHSLLLAACALAQVAGYPNRASDSAISCKPVNPLPKECGVAGKFRPATEPYYPFTEPQKVSAVEECAALCARRVFSPKNYQPDPHSTLDNENWCSSFEYDEDEKICQLSKMNISQSIVPDSQSHKIFYSYQCYDCGRVCNQPYGAQLLDNGDFEEPLLGPWSSTDGRISKEHNSVKAYNCVGPDPGCSLFQSVNLCSGDLYRFQFDYLFSPATSNKPITTVSANIGYVSGGYSYTSTQSFPDPNPSWKTARGFVQIEGAHYGPEFVFFNRAGSNETHHIFIDNVIVSRAPYPNFNPKKNSVFENGGFESGQLGSFKSKQYPGSKGAFKIVSPGLGNSSYAIQYKVTGGTNQNSPYLTQVLSTKPYVDYVLSFEMLTHDLWDVTVQVGPPTERSIYEFTTSTGQTTFSIPVHTTRNQTEFSLEVFKYTNGNIVFDNFSLVQPTSAFHS